MFGQSSHTINELYKELETISFDKQLKMNVYIFLVKYSEIKWDEWCFIWSSFMWLEEGFTWNHEQCWSSSSSMYCLVILMRTFQEFVMYISCFCHVYLISSWWTMPISFILFVDDVSSRFLIVFFIIHGTYDLANFFVVII